MICAAAAARRRRFSCRLAALAQKAPEETVKSLKVAEGLEVTLWASEPGLVNPTDMDIDERGRVWVTEGANYRGSSSAPTATASSSWKTPTATASCDSYKVFVPGPGARLAAGHLRARQQGLRLAVAEHARLHDRRDAGDKPAGKPEVLFTGFGGVNHDHGVHAIVFGPDGRFYFNSGNDGVQRRSFKTGDGKPVVDSTGSEVGGKGQDVPRPAQAARDSIGYHEGHGVPLQPRRQRLRDARPQLPQQLRARRRLASAPSGSATTTTTATRASASTTSWRAATSATRARKGTDWGRDQDAFPGQTRQEAHWHQR